LRPKKNLRLSNLFWGEQQAVVAFVAAACIFFEVTRLTKKDRQNRIDAARHRVDSPRMIRALLILAAVALAPAAIAQPAKIQSAPPEADAPSNKPKKLPATLEPTPAPTAGAPKGPIRTPDEIVGTFFAALQADKVDAAYDTLDAEFAMMDRGDQSKAMRAQTQKALDAYGPVLGSELVSEEKFGTHLLRRTYVLVGDQLPLRWKFYFYKSADRWKLIDLRIDDALVEWFDEAPKKTAP